MDSHAAVSTPPSRRSEARLLRSRPPPCLAQPFDDDDSSDNNNNNSHAVTPPPKTKSPISPSPLHLSLHASNHSPLQELLLLSHSPARRQRSLVLFQAENVDPAASNPRRKSKKSVATAATAAASMGLMGCASPRNVRRARRRLEKEINREERPSDVFEDDVVRVRRRRQSKTANSRREKPSLPLAAPPPGPPPVDKTTDNNEQIGLDGLKEVISELIMWKNVARSSLWFGLGSLFFISSSFSRDLSFCAVSAVSNVGLLSLALAFFGDSISQRRRHEKVEKRFGFTEEDILRVIRLVLPAINAAIGNAQQVFSGEPAMTLKVAPVLLFAAKYGHHITLWRLLATGFFLGFTAPKLYACYSSQILTQADNRWRSVSEAWRGCRRKKILAISAATVLWNLSTVKTRVFAAFICLVVLRYYRQRHYSGEEEEEGAAGGGGDGSQPQQDEETTQKLPGAYALVVAGKTNEQERHTGNGF